VHHFASSHWGEYKKESALIKQVVFIALIAFIGLSAPAYSAAPRNEDLQPTISSKPGAVSETDMLKDALAVPYALPRGPQELLNDYEEGMAYISQQFSAALGALVQAVQKGELSRQQAEIMSGEEYQAARMQFELLSALHELLQQDVARASVTQPPAPTEAKQNDIVTVELPFSSLELSPSLAEYLRLSSEQISAIEKLMSEERHNLEPLMTQMQANKTKLLAASGHRQTNEKEVKALATTQAAMLTELIVSNSRMQEKLYKLLTPEQQKKLDDFRRSSESSLRAGD